MPDDPAQSQPPKTQPEKPLEYEETPLIEPIIEKTPVPSSPTSVQPHPPPPPLAKPAGSKPSFFKKFFGFIGNIIFFAFLFAIGMWLSTILRQFLPTGIEEKLKPEETTTTAPTPTVPLDPTALWIRYPVLSGATKQPVAGISFKLPPDVLAPVCDGVSCNSQGTYLPGGTRFTVSIRATSLSFMQRAIITDAAGRAFTSREATVSGSPAIEYTGVFQGTTTGGYTFSQMRGFMIGATDRQTLEINHFAPAGVTVDFVSDDALFDQILKTVKLPTTPSIPSVTSTPTL